MRHCILGVIGVVALGCGANDIPDTDACRTIAVAGAPASCGGASNLGGASNAAGTVGGAAPNAGAMPPSTPSATGGAAPSMGPPAATGAGGAFGPVTGSGGSIGTGGTTVGGAPATNSGGSSGMGGGAPTTTGVSFSSITTLLAGTCGGTQCHTTRQKPALANNPNLYMTLVNTAVSECGGAHLVVPGNADGSAIIQLVNRRCTKSGKAFYMPRTCTTNPCLPAAQLQTITAWIQAGAPAQ